MFRWSDDATEEAKAAVADALSGLPSAIPEIRRYEFGGDLGLREGNWDFAVVADFDDADGYRAYSADATHQQVIADHIAPNTVERAAVQYELPG
jgi:hypothetical protein